MLLFFHFPSFGQSATIIPLKIAVLRDSLTNNKYVLDSSHTYIMAFNSCGDYLWTSYTCLSNFNFGYSNLQQVKIHSMWFGKNTDAGTCKKCKEQKVIWIGHDMCSGYIDINNGKYHGFGCD